LFKSSKDDKLPCKNVKNVVLSLGFKTTDTELEPLLEYHTGMGDTSLDFVDFLTILGSLLHASDEEEIKEAFRIFDKDGNGSISRYELRHVMMNLGEKLTDEEVDEMVAEADIDGDGEISYPEFLQMLRN